MRSGSKNRVNKKVTD